MRILILGSEGYIGHALSNSLVEDGHIVWGIDNFSREQRVKAISSDSLTDNKPSNVRNFYRMDLDVDIRDILKEFKPEAIYHLAEQPSAPWSMIDWYTSWITQKENVLGTLFLIHFMIKHCPNAHLIKIGTMGEYGTPDCEIPEGLIPKYCLESKNVFGSCPMKGLMFPRTAGSWYHLSKVHDTHNIKFACDTFGLRSTDIMQGVVYGHMYNTRFDYDEYFGTCINRFCAQALIEYPLTVYGKGGQTRGYLPLKDSIQCLKIALHNPPEAGEYRTWNQFEYTYSVNTLAQIVKDEAKKLDLYVEIDHIPNPRQELESHYYNPHHTKLIDLGYEPTEDIGGEVFNLLKAIYPYRDRVNPEVIKPRTYWRKKDE